jgi:octaprenyl-diphosphate synthase
VAKKTANNIWGNKIAILLGDFLLSHSFQLMVDCKNIKALDMLSKTAIALTESEIWQLEMLGDATTNMDRYLRLIIGKTAKLFATGCSISALLQDEAFQYFDALHEFGMNIGILYQIVDDILDYSAVNPKFGKSVGGDLLEKKITLPLIKLIEDADHADRSDVITTFESDAPDIDLIIRMMNKYSSINKSKEIASDYARQCLRSLDSMPSNIRRDGVIELVHFLIDRCY